MKIVCLSLFLLISMLEERRWAVAQASSDLRARADMPPSLTASHVDASVAIDGFLDEAAWQQAEPVTGFRQFEPDEGAPATQPAEVRVLYGASGLYIGAMLFDTDPSEIERALGRRDEFNRADWFLVSIDSYFDKRTAYTFGVNAGGVQFDAIQTSARRGGGGGNAPEGMDPSWNAVWSPSQRLTPEGWAVEIRIPYSMLRFSDAASQTWGIHFTRTIPRLGEQSEWPHVPRTDRENLVARFGHLTGIANIQPRRNLQVSPYSMARVHTRERPDVPGSVARNSSLDVGGDLKMGLGPNITLDATINPDFGQVESDPAVLNLTAFETEFEERRPFFTEGMQIYSFDFGPGRLPYTRRIGAQVPIVGAAKLSGRTARGLSFGLLGATTGDEFKPLHHYGIARATQQVGTYSSVGGIVTTFDGTPLGLEGRRRSLVGGADYDLRFLDNRYSFEGFAAITQRWQTQSDMEGNTGFAGKVLFGKREGDLNGFTGVEAFSNLGDFNDVGLVEQNNFVSLFLRFEYLLNGGQPFGPFLRASFGDFASQRFSYDEGLNQGQSHRFSSNWTLRSFQEIELGASFQNPFGGYDTYETRGLGPWARPATVELQAAFETDSRRNWRFGPQLSMEFVDGGGRGYGLGANGEWNIGNRLFLSGSMEGRWEDGTIAWTSNEAFFWTGDTWMIGADAGRPISSGPEDFIAFDDSGLLTPILGSVTPYATNRYFVPVFGARDTRAMDLTLRGTVTLTPDLSLQLYSQLFLARGRYDDFGILQNRDELAPFDAFPKRDAFAFSNFQSNAVLRWEYRPGSTLFVVWTHGRRTDDVLNPLAPWGSSPYDRPLGRQIDDTFGVLPDNVFLVKLSYTFLR